MKRAALVIAALAAFSLSVAGCAAPEVAQTPTPAAEPSTTPTPSEAAEAAPTALGMCEIMGEKFLAYPDYVLALMDGDTSDHPVYLEWANALTEAAPGDARTIVAKFTDPVFQVENVIQAGGGALTLTTDDYKAGTMEIMEYCVAAGYKINQ